MGCVADQLHKPVDRVLTIPSLRTEPPSVDNEYAVFSNPPASQRNQTLANPNGQGGGVRHVKTKLHSCGNLVDILPTRSRRANELLLDLGLINRDVVRYMNHISRLRQVPHLMQALAEYQSDCYIYPIMAVYSKASSRITPWITSCAIDAVHTWLV